LTQAAHVSSILEAIIKQAMMQEKKKVAADETTWSVPHSGSII